jgi:hypothetical protein
MLGDADSGAIARNVQPFVVFGVFSAHGGFPFLNGV